VKKIAIISLFFTVLFANLQDKIENFMGAKEYAKSENLIKILFKNEAEFYRESD
jgi:hypothetical protein